MANIVHHKLKRDIETTKKHAAGTQSKLPVLEEAFKAAKAVSHELKIASDEYELAAKAQPNCPKSIGKKR